MNNVITLIDDNEIISNNISCAEILNSYFINAGQELEINRSLHINNERKLEDPIDNNIDRFKNQPSINRIYQSGFTSNSFHFRKIVIDDVYEVLKSLNPSKAFQNDNIPQQTNHRPVSILATSAKVYEKLLYLQIYDYFDRIFSKYLGGFRKGHSTQHVY